MSSDLDNIKREFNQIDNTIGIAFNSIFIVLILLGMALLFWNGPPSGNSTYFLISYATAISFQIVGMIVVRKKKQKVLVKYGFRCQSCHRTPYPTHFFRGANHSFCPHCMLKYWPDNKTA